MTNIESRWSRREMNGALARVASCGSNEEEEGEGVSACSTSPDRVRTLRNAQEK